MRLFSEIGPPRNIFEANAFGPSGGGIYYAGRRPRREGGLAIAIEMEAADARRQETSLRLIRSLDCDEHESHGGKLALFIFIIIILF